jgi:predicted AlkP superfamily pyrophosphatase or phosphodiesterase
MQIHYSPIKKTVLLFVLIFSVVVTNALTAEAKAVKDLKTTVILISLDGFRADYLDKYDAPNIKELAGRGVRAKWMTPVFPSLTFPNHYSIATGLYPENHGIVGNSMFDPTFKAMFSLGKREEVENSRWWGGEPIWITAEKQGQKAGTFFFPGTETEIDGKRPSYWKRYDGKVPYNERTDQILAWLDLPQAERPTFFTLYFEEPDKSGHVFSPDSPEVAKAILEVDAQIGRLVAGLKERKIFKKVNIIIVSDHGMTAVKPNDVVLLDNYFDIGKADPIVWGGQVTNIFPKENEAENIATALNSTQIPNAQCYRKSAVPARFNYQDSIRIAPVICMANEGWSLTSKEFYERNRKNAAQNARTGGAHGYDHELASMRAIFIAHGAAFKKKKVVEPFENVNVYNIMTEILSLKPAKNDGNMDAAKAVLKNSITE